MDERTNEQIPQLIEHGEDEDLSNRSFHSSNLVKKTLLENILSEHTGSEKTLSENTLLERTPPGNAFFRK